MSTDLVELLTAVCEGSKRAEQAATSLLERPDPAQKIEHLAAKVGYLEQKIPPAMQDMHKLRKIVDDYMRFGMELDTYRYAKQKWSAYRIAATSIAAILLLICGGVTGFVLHPFIDPPSVNFRAYLAAGNQTRWLRCEDSGERVRASGRPGCRLVFWLDPPPPPSAE